MEILIRSEPKAVAYVCLERGNARMAERVPIATSFLVLVDDLDLPWTYIVTSRHVVENAERDTIYVRFNRTNKTYVDIPTKRHDWSTHYSDDVAAILFEPPNNVQDIDCKRIPLRAFVTGGPDNYHFRDDDESELVVRVGLEVYFVGLFSQHWGREQNSPIARFGRISRMPELVTLQRDEHNDFQAQAYLIECLSWGGHSGSPAFCLLPGSQRILVTEVGKHHLAIPQGVSPDTHAFLGLVSHHYDIPRRARITGDILGDIEADLNSGIAVVTPADRIVGLLARGDLADDRRKRKTKSGTASQPN